jgi:hypothetical protein
VIDPSDSGCELDGVNYHRVMMDGIHAGFASVPLMINDHGKTYRTKTLAGSFEIKSKLKEIENLCEKKRMWATRTLKSSPSQRW